MRRINLGNYKIIEMNDTNMAAHEGATRRETCASREARMFNELASDRVIEVLFMRKRPRNSKDFCADLVFLIGIWGSGSTAALVGR